MNIKKIEIMEKEKGFVVINLNIAATQFETLNGVMIGNPIDVIRDNLNTFGITQDLFHRPVIRGIRELALYYTGKTLRSHDEIKKMVESDGFSFIVAPHPSLLISAMRQLSREKIAELGMEGKEIVLTGNESFKIKGTKCFFSVATVHDIRILSPHGIIGKKSDILVLVEKK